MIKSNKKKKGFTLIEMVAVVAIIGILAAILVPKITGYMKEAKKTGVIDQARKVSQAYETAVMKGKASNIDTSADGSAKNIKNVTMLSLLDIKYTENGGTVTANSDDIEKILGKLDKDASIDDCLRITRGAEFTVTTNGVLESGNVDSSVATN